MGWAKRATLMGPPGPKGDRGDHGLAVVSNTEPATKVAGMMWVHPGHHYLQVWDSAPTNGRWVPIGVYAGNNPGQELQDKVVAGTIHVQTSDSSVWLNTDGTHSGWKRIYPGGTGPRGATGPKGDKGDRGATGPRGATGSISDAHGDGRYWKLAAGQRVGGSFTLSGNLSFNNDQAGKAFVLYKDGQVVSKAVYARTSSTAVNLLVGSNGSFHRHSSSGTHKRDWAPLQTPLDKVLALGPGSYRSMLPADEELMPGHRFAGFATEEVVQHMPEAYAGTDENGVMAAYDPNAVMAYLVGAFHQLVQDHRTEVAELKTRIAALEAT